VFMCAGRECACMHACGACKQAHMHACAIF
jgi:hypothetical protein